MKLFYIECSTEDLKVNRGLMDNVVDACTDVFNSIFGSHASTIINDDGKEDDKDGDDE